MKIIGKIMLFFSSYLLLFIVLLLSEIENLLDPNVVKTPIALMIIIYVIFILISIYSILAFKKNYAFGTISTKTTISIRNISSGSQEIISYLITMVIPLLGINSISIYISINDWIKLSTMILIILFILILYVNTNLVVVNPILILSGYSIHKINFYFQDSSEIEFEGVLLSDKKLDLTSIASKTIVDEIDNNIFILRRM